MSRKRGSTLSRVARSRHLPSCVAYGRSSFPSRSMTRVENKRPSPSGAGPRETIHRYVAANAQTKAVDTIAKVNLRPRHERMGLPLPEGEKEGVRGFGRTYPCEVRPPSP